MRYFAVSGIVILIGLGTPCLTEEHPIRKLSYNISDIPIPKISNKEAKCIQDLVKDKESYYLQPMESKPPCMWSLSLKSTPFYSFLPN
jgi:hypothetical protein